MRESTRKKIVELLNPFRMDVFINTQHNLLVYAYPLPKNDFQKNFLCFKESATLKTKDCFILLNNKNLYNTTSLKINILFKNKIYYLDSNDLFNQCDNITNSLSWEEAWIRQFKLDCP